VKKDLESKVQEIARKLGVEPHVVRYLALALGLSIIGRALDGSSELRRQMEKAVAEALSIEEPSKAG